MREIQTWEEQHTVSTLEEMVVERPKAERHSEDQKLSEGRALPEPNQRAGEESPEASCEGTAGKSPLMDQQATEKSLDLFPGQWTPTEVEYLGKEMLTYVILCHLPRFWDHQL